MDLFRSKTWKQHTISSCFEITTRVVTRVTCCQQLPSHGHPDRLCITIIESTVSLLRLMNDSERSFHFNKVMPQSRSTRLQYLKGVILLNHPLCRFKASRRQTFPSSIAGTMTIRVNHRKASTHTLERLKNTCSTFNRRHYSPTFQASDSETPTSKSTSLQALRSHKWSWTGFWKSMSGCRRLKEWSLMAHSEIGYLSPKLRYNAERLPA